MVWGYVLLRSTSDAHAAGASWIMRDGLVLQRMRGLCGTDLLPAHLFGERRPPKRSPCSKKEACRHVSSVQAGVRASTC
jgi:hypothetical protein